MGAGAGRSCREDGARDGGGAVWGERLWSCLFTTRARTDESGDPSANDNRATHNSVPIWGAFFSWETRKEDDARATGQQRRRRRTKEGVLFSSQGRGSPLRAWGVERRRRLSSHEDRHRRRRGRKRPRKGSQESPRRQVSVRAKSSSSRWRWKTSRC